MYKSGNFCTIGTSSKGSLPSQVKAILQFQYITDQNPKETVLITDVPPFGSIDMVQALVGSDAIEGVKFPTSYEVTGAVQSLYAETINLLHVNLQQTYATTERGLDLWGMDKINTPEAEKLGRLVTLAVKDLTLQKPKEGSEYYISCR